MSSDLSSWAAASSRLMFTDDALAAGRRKAADVWNSFPTDVSGGSALDVAVPARGGLQSSQMFEDAAFAFAFLAESLRIDSQKMVVRGSGIDGDPSQVLSSLTELALQAVAEYTQWVADNKPLMEAGNMGL